MNFRYSQQGLGAFFRLGKNGLAFKSDGAVLQVRNTTDTDFGDFRALGAELASLHVNSEVGSGTIAGGTLKAFLGNLLVSRVDAVDPSRFVSIYGPSGAFTAYAFQLPASAPARVGQVLRSTSVAGGYSGAAETEWGDPGLAVVNAAAATVTAQNGQRVYYDPATTTQVNAPGAPVQGALFAIKRAAYDGSNVTISGNGNSIEVPAGTGLAASFVSSTAAESIVWQWNSSGALGAAWYLLSRWAPPS